MKSKYIVELIREKNIEETCESLIALADCNWGQDAIKISNDLAKLAFLGVIYDRGESVRNLFAEVEAVIDFYYNSFKDSE